MELIVSVLAGFLIVELYSWLPYFSNWLLERAVRRVRAEDQDLCREQWTADLNALPNTLVRLYYVLRFISISAADMINAEFFVDKCDEIDDMFEEIASQHQRDVETFRKIVSEHGKLRGKSGLALAHWHSTLDLKQGDTPNVPLVELEKLKVSLDEFGNTLIRATDRTHELLSVRINHLGLKLEHIDSLLKIVSKRRDEVTELLRKKNTSSDILAATVRSITDDLGTIKSLSAEDEDWADEESGKEFYRINEAITNVFRSHGVQC
jgi:hypothetical protein